MFTRSRLQVGVLMVAVVTLSGRGVRAQGVGNIGQLPVSIPMNTPSGWNITDATGGPLPVVLNPAGPVWAKFLTGPNGQVFSAVPGQTFTLHESLVVGGTLPWKDWHEKIVNPFWDWTSSTFLVNGAAPSPLLTINNPATALTGGGLNFFFNAIAPGSVVDISKTMTFNAPVGTVFQGILQVREFPTPEPGSLLLMAGASALLIKRRRRITADIA